MSVEDDQSPSPFQLEYRRKPRGEKITASNLIFFIGIVFLFVVMGGVVSMLVWLTIFKQ